VATTPMLELDRTDQRLEQPILAPGNTLVLATHNPDKLKQLRLALTDLPLRLVPAGDLGLAAPEETGSTFAAIATLKARQAARAVGVPALSDDGGFCVSALGGAPGPRSCDWARPPGDYGPALDRLGHFLGYRQPSDPLACFTSVLALALPDGRCETLEASTWGRVTWPPRGDGHDYDPVFIPDGYDCTAAELDPSGAGDVERQSYRHRATAARALIIRCLGHEAT
jgi:XTP/dITP diphosphohydrolase